MKELKKRLFLLVNSLFAVFGLHSCLEMESVVTLKKDGSGTINEQILFGEQMMGMMAMGGAGGEDPFAQMMDEEEGKKKAEQLGEGVEYVGGEKVEVNGKQGVKLTFNFKDINTIKYEGFSGDDMKGPGGGEKKPKTEEDFIKFVYKDGELSIGMPQPKGEDGEAVEEEEEDEMAKAMMAQMKDSLKGMKMAVKIVLEDGIAETNATHVEGNTIVLADMLFDSLLENPELFDKMMKSSDFASLGKELEDVDGVKIETKEKVSVKLK